MLNLVRGILVVATLWVSVPIGTPAAHADVCPDIDVTFARGTDEPPGIGKIGQAFINALRADVRGKKVGVYAVNYPAIKNWATTAQGVADASAHLLFMATNCPNTRLVIGGYSQGASVVNAATADALPPLFAPPFGSPAPLPPFVANHVTSVVLFGIPSINYLDSVGAPLVPTGQLYAAKMLNMCLPDDPVCSLGGRNDAAHNAYADNGMTAQTASVTAQRVG